MLKTVILRPIPGGWLIITQLNDPDPAKWYWAICRDFPTEAKIKDCARWGAKCSALSQVAAPLRRALKASAEYDQNLKKLLP